MREKFPIVILVGGYGSRISKITKKIPKPMIKITSNPFLRDLVNYLIKFNFKKIYLLGFYKFNIIEKEFKNYKKNKISIECIKEKKKLGTGGALFFLKKKITKDFFLINGDTFFKLDYKKFLKFTSKNNSLVSIALTKRNKISNKLNGIKILKKNLISFSKEGNYMNGGIYYIKKKLLNEIKYKKISLENDIILKLIKKNKVSGKYFNDYFIDIGSYENLKLAKKEFLKKL